MIGLTNCAGANKATLYAIANIGDTVTITLGTKTQSKTLTSGTAVKFTILKFGTWTVTNGDYSGTISIPAPGDYEINTLGYVFGIRRSITSSSSAWERTDNSVGLTVTPSIGTIAGHSDFDNYPPFNQIEREIIGENTFVKIPKFWFRRYRDDTYEYIKISNVSRENFIVHPAFQHNNSTQDYIYIGAYKMNSAYKSISGTQAVANKSIGTFRDGAAALGTGYGLVDVSTRFAIMTLMLVEFADNNVQSVIGQGLLNTDNYTVGSCDSLSYYTGRTADSDPDTVWRGIEGLWSAFYEYIDGLKLYGGAYYICNDQSVYNSSTNNTDYAQLGYTLGADKDNKYYAYCGYDSSNPAYFLPITDSAPTSNPESSTTYVCDALSCNDNNTWYAAGYGGEWWSSADNRSRCGLYCAKLDFGIASTSDVCGARLLYVPS